MLNKRKKLLSVLLSASMLLGMAVPGFAAEAEVVEDPVTVEVEAETESLDEALGAVEETLDEAGADETTVSHPGWVTVGNEIPVDIVFVLDRTGSMGDDIAHVRNEIKGFLGHLKDYSLKTGEKISPMISLISFGNLAYNEKTITYKFDGKNFTDDGDALYDTLRKISITGGGDWAETPTEGLQFLCEDDYGWRLDSQKFVFMITDEPYKDSTHYNSRLKAKGITVPDMPDVADKLHGKGICVSAVTRLAEKIDYELLWNMNLGKWYDITKELDFNEVLDSVIKVVENPTLSLMSGEFGEIDMTYMGDDGYEKTMATSLNHKVMSNSVLKGSSAEFKVTPYPGYEIERVAVNDVERPLSGNTALYNGKIESIDVSTVVSATFKKVTKCIVSVNSGNGGTTDKDGQNEVENGSIFTITATPNDGYDVSYFDITTVLEDGTIVTEQRKAGEGDGTTDSRSIDLRVKGDTVVNVEFIISELIITEIGAENGTIVNRRYLGAAATGSQAYTDYEYDSRVAGLESEGFMKEVKVRVKKNSSPFFEIIPYDGYEVKDVLVDGQVDEEYHNKSMAELTHDGLVNDKGNIYKVFDEVTENHTLSAIFGLPEVPTYNVAAQATGQGTIEFEGGTAVRKNSTNITVSGDEVVTVVMRPDQPGFLLEVRDNDENVTNRCVSANNVYTYTVNTASQNHTIIATFEPEEEKVYEIEAEADDDGNITPDGLVSVSANQDQTFTIKPDSDCMLAEVKVDNIAIDINKDLVKLSGNEVAYQYTFKNVTSDHTIYATFAEKVGTDGTDDYYVHWTKKVPYDGRKHDRMGVKQESKKVVPDIEVKVFSYNGTKREDVSNYIKKVTFKNQKKAAKADSSKAPYLRIKMSKDCPLNAAELKNLKKKTFKFEIEPAALSDNLIKETHKTGNNGVKLTLEYKIPKADKTDSGYTCKMKYTKNGSKSDYTYTQPDANGYVTVTGQNNFEGEVKIKVS